MAAALGPPVDIESAVAAAPAARLLPSDLSEPVLSFRLKPPSDRSIFAGRSLNCHKPRLRPFYDTRFATLSVFVPALAVFAARPHTFVAFAEVPAWRPVVAPPILPPSVELPPYHMLFAALPGQRGRSRKPAQIPVLKAAVVVAVRILAARKPAAEDSLDIARKPAAGENCQVVADHNKPAAGPVLKRLLVCAFWMLAYHALRESAHLPQAPGTTDKETLGETVGTLAVVYHNSLEDCRTFLIDL